MTIQPTWKYVIGLYRFRPGISTIHGVAWFVFNLTYLVPGWAIARLVDELATARQFTGAMVVPMLALCGYGILQALMWLLGGYTETVMRYQVRCLVRTNVLERLISGPVFGREAISTGDTVNRFEEDMYQVEDVLDWSNEAWYGLAIGVFAFGMLIGINARLAFISVVPMISVLALAQIARSRLEKYREISRSTSGSVSGAIGDVIRASNTLQAMNAGANAVSHVAVLSERRRRAAIIDRLATETLDAISVNIITLGTGVFMLLAANSIHEHQLSAGEFTLFLFYLGVIADFAANFVMYLAFTIQARVSILRLHELVGNNDTDALVRHRSIYLQGPLPASPEPAPLEPLRLLSVSNLSSAHRDGELAITNVSLDLAGGTTTVVTGRIGSGKSALVRSILGQEEIVGGNIKWNDTTVPDPLASFVPPSVASIGQVPALFSDTIRMNIELGWRVDKAQMDRALHVVDLHQDLSEMPAGLETRVGTRGITLSGGQVQRTAAARMLVRDAELLVIDDLSSALDVETERRLWERLRADTPPTALVVSNRLPVLRSADQILVMERGSIIDRGTFAELIGRCEAFRSIIHDAVSSEVDAGRVGAHPD